MKQVIQVGDQLRERQTYSLIQTYRERDIQSDTDIQRETHTESDTDIQRERERERERHTVRYRHTHTNTQQTRGQAGYPKTQGLQANCPRLSVCRSPLLPACLLV